MIDELEEMLNNVTAHTSLGHSKRDEAFIRQVANMCEHPGGTGSGSNNSMAGTMSAYRFASNEAVDLASLRKTRLNTALESCSHDETLLVINDISILDYFRHDSKEDRRRVGDDRGKGYEYVCNLGLSLETEQPIGVLHDCLINIDGPNDADQIDYYYDSHFDGIASKDPMRLKCNHKHILNCHIKYIADQVKNKRIIQVADREFDDHFIFETCMSSDVDFVIRSKSERNVQVSSHLEWIPESAIKNKYAGLPLLSEHICVSMKELVDNVPVTPYKSIPLDARGKLTDDKSAKSHVDVSIGSFEVILYRNAKRNRTYLKPREYIPLNVVVVKEENVPENRAPIQWVLYTTMPVDTQENLEKVVRIYELRWLIECFFKYLKSGFKLEDLRYNDARKTAIHLVATTIAATFLIKLKNKVGLPCSSSKLSTEDYKKVKDALKNPNDSTIPKDLRLFALIANKGGWLGRKSDPISPMTLIKGYKCLTDALEIIENANSLIKYALKTFGTE